jgi:hypothetical protein
MSSTAPSFAQGGRSKIIIGLALSLVINLVLLQILALQNKHKRVTESSVTVSLLRTVAPKARPKVNLLPPEKKVASICTQCDHDAPLEERGLAGPGRNANCSTTTTGTTGTDRCAWRQSRRFPRARRY